MCEAYEVLSNKEKRQTYDQFGRQGLNSSGMAGGGFSRGQAEEIFAQFFGGQDPFSVLFSQMGEGGGMGGNPGVSFQFGGMPGGMGGMGGGRGGGLPPEFAQMMGGMGGMPGGMGGMGGMPGGMGGMGGMPGMGGARGRPQPEQPGVLTAGTRVTVRGLQGAAQHNGKTGRVESYDAAGGRYTVQLDEGAKPMVEPRRRGSSPRAHRPPPTASCA